jgi:hypothetical protein
LQLHKNLIKEFDNHVVTKEMASGPEAESSILGYGNLFSFIGFNSNEKPIEKLRQILVSNITLNKTPDIKSRKFGIVFSFPVNMPKNIEEQTPMPEWTNGSWITQIEKGISGLQYFLFSRSKKFKNSRSGPAVQLKKSKLRQNAFKGIDYLSEIFENFKNRLL